MAIQNILINVADTTRAATFYQHFLGAELIGEVTEDQALLDLVTATIRLVKTSAPTTSTWKPDDLQRGFRHVGFKVAAVDPIVEELKASGVQFHLEPLNAEGEVRITFFFDPDGTILELVEGDLQYHEIADQQLVAAERALGVPVRPRFDHIALTVADLPATREYYARFGFDRIGVINQPSDPRGFEINYLKAGDSVLEIFTYDAEKYGREPQLEAPGFTAVHLQADADHSESGRVVGEAGDGHTVYADPDGFPYAIVR